MSVATCTTSCPVEPHGHIDPDAPRSCFHSRTEHGGVPGETRCSDCGVLVSTQDFEGGWVSDGWRRWDFHLVHDDIHPWPCGACGDSTTGAIIVSEIDERWHYTGPHVHLACAEDAARVRVEDVLARLAKERQNWCRVWDREEWRPPAPRVRRPR